RARPAMARTRALRPRGRVSRSARFSPSLVLECGFKQAAHRSRQSERRQFLARKPSAIAVICDRKFASACEKQRRYAQMIVAECMDESCQRARLLRAHSVALEQ